MQIWYSMYIAYTIEVGIAARCLQSKIPYVGLQISANVIYQDRYGV